MFERFTERARQVIVLAQEEVREHGKGRIDSVAVLLGLLREEEGLAARVLAGLDVRIETVRERWPELDNEPLPVGIEPNTEKGGQVPFTKIGKKCLELSLREALSLGHNYIGTEHILLGLVRGGDSIAADLLQEMGVGPQRLRDEVIHSLTGKPAASVRAEQAAQEIRDREQHGREVYEVFVAALAAEVGHGRYKGQPPVAFDFLSAGEQEAWKTLAHQYLHVHTFKLAA